jgi:hypothetical protein
MVIVCLFIAGGALIAGLRLDCLVVTRTLGIFSQRGPIVAWRLRCLWRARRHRRVYE